MAIPNLVSLILLHRVIAAETNKYLWSGKLDKVDEADLALAQKPTVRAAKVGL